MYFDSQYSLNSVVDIRSLFEARRNPDVNAGNRWKDVVKHIEPYFGQKDAYVSMVNVPKIGIHPMSGHDSTPTAIYCYPLAQIEIMKQFDEGNLPYMSWARYAALIFEKPGLKKLSCDMSEAEAEEAMAKLDQMMNQVIRPKVWSDLKVEATRTGSNQSHEHYGYLYVCTQAAAQVLSMRLQTGDEGTYSARDFRDRMNDGDNTRPRVWNSLLRRLGFDAIEDKGTRFIHNIEPRQTGFLHIGCIAHYEMFRNGKSEVYGHSKDGHHEVRSANHLFTLIKSGKIGTADALAFMDTIIKRNGDQPPAGESKYYSFDPSIRLSRSQVMHTFAFLKKQDPQAVAKWMNHAAIFAGSVPEPNLYSVLFD